MTIWAVEITQRVPKKAYASSGMLEETWRRVSSFWKSEWCATRCASGRQLQFTEFSPNSAEFLHSIVPRNIFWDVPCMPSMLRNGWHYGKARLVAVLPSPRCTLMRDALARPPIGLPLHSTFMQMQINQEKQRAIYTASTTRFASAGIHAAWQSRGSPSATTET